MLDKILPKSFLNKTKVESVKHPFIGKIPYGRNNVAYYLLNGDLSLSDPLVGLHTPNTHPSVNASKPSMPQRIEKAV